MSSRLAGQAATVRRLTRAAASTFAVRGFGTAIGFASHLALARWMGLEQYGPFIYVYVWTLALGLLAKFGFDRSAVRFGAQLMAERAYGEFATLVRTTLRISLMVGLGVAALLAVAAELFAEGPLRLSFWIGALAVPMLGLHQVFLGLAQGLQNPAQATVPELLLRNALFALLAVAYWGADLGPPTAAAGIALHVLSVAGTLLVDVVWMHKALPREVHTAIPAPPKREWVSYAMQMAVFSNVIAWMMQMDVLLVGAIAGSAAAGAYSVASRLASFVPWASLAAMTLFAPMVAELSKGGDSRLLQRVTTVLARRIAAVSTGFAFSLGLASPWLLGWFGAGFEQAALPLLILLAAFVIPDWLGPASTLMNYSGHHAKALRVVLAGATLSFGLHLLLIPKWGPVGAALATSCAVLSNALALFWMARRQLGVDTSVLGVAPVRGPRDPGPRGPA